MARFAYVVSTLALLLVVPSLLSPIYSTNATNLEEPTTIPSGLPPSSAEDQTLPVTTIPSGLLPSSAKDQALLVTAIPSGFPPSSAEDQPPLVTAIPSGLLPSSAKDQALPVAAIPSGFLPHPTKTGLSTGQTHQTRSVEDMEANLAVNQLAILHLLDGESTGGECKRTTEAEGMSEVLAEVRKIREDLSFLRESQTSFQWRQFELREGLVEVKESLAEMRDGVKILEASLGELKGNHDQLNDTLTKHNYSLSTLGSRVSVNGDSLSTLGSRVSVNGDSLSTLGSRVSVNGDYLSTLGSRVSVNGDSLSTLESRVSVNGDSLSTLESHVSVNGESLSTLESRVSIHNYSLDTVTDHMGTLDSHIGTLHSITMIQNITMGTMMEEIQMLQDNDEVFQNVTNHLKEEYDAHQENIFKLHSLSGTFFRHEGQTFFINTESTLNWTESRQWCRAHGADLAQPTGNLGDFLQEVLKHAPTEPSGDKGVWMGASDMVEEGQWLWLSGLSLSTDFPWGDEQPNGGTSQNCLEIWYNGSTKKDYNDRSCSDSKYCVCGT